MYAVDFITDFDLLTTQGAHAYEHFIDVAESDVRAKYFEKYLEAVKVIKNS